MSDKELIAIFIGFTRYFPNMKPEYAFSKYYRYPRIDNVFHESLYVSEVIRTSAEGRFRSIDITEAKHVDEFPFDKSWDLLMPVVAKLQTLAIPEALLEALRITVGNAHLENAYAMVITCIKRYNHKS